MIVCGVALVWYREQSNILVSELQIVVATDMELSYSVLNPPYGAITRNLRLRLVQNFCTVMVCGVALVSYRQKSNISVSMLQIDVITDMKPSKNVIIHHTVL